MNILITGGAGFIGFNLAKEFAQKKNNKIYIIDIINKKNFDDELKNFLKENTNVFYKNIDLLNLNSKLKKTNFSYIIHLAAILGVANVISKPDKVMEFNILGILEIIKFSKKQKKLKKLCFTSTSEVYANTIKENKKLIPTNEKVSVLMMNDFTSRDSYLTSKFFGEMMIKYSKLPYLIFRPHNIYGPRMGNRHVVPQLINKMLGLKKNLNIFSPNHTRSFCYIDDAIKMMSRSIFSNTKNQLINIGNQGEEIKIFELAKKIKNKISKDIVLKKGKNHLGSPKRRVPCMKKYHITFGKIDLTTLDVGLEKTFKWYKDYFHRK